MRKFLAKCTATCNLLSVVGAMAVSASPAQAGAPCNPSCPNTFNVSPNVPECGAINGAGATLFSDFFRANASTNDFIDVDGDGCFGFSVPPQPGCAGVVDQLAPNYTQPVFTGCWLFNYRSVGSVGGVNEFIQYACTGEIFENIPGEASLLNRSTYATGGLCSGGFATCQANCSPICISSIDFALADVPGIWSTRPTDENGASWDRTPGLTGYGFNPKLSNTGYTFALPTLNCLNGNIQNPDANTIYETTVAWGPIAFITNRKTGVQNISISQLQHLFVSGRMPNGENLVASTRTNSSGTRNGIMNCVGIDPAWGRGDNIGSDSALNNNFILGPGASGTGNQPTQAQGSGNIELVVQNWGLAIGYTGLAGASRAVLDSRAGQYEILNVTFDNRGGTTPVRPGIDSVLDNCDPNSGYPIGGAVTFTTVGNPFETDTNSPAYMDSRPTAAYLQNIVDSIAAYEGDPGNLANDAMPGEYLAQTFFALPGIDCQPSLSDPDSPVASTPFDQGLQDFVRTSNNFGVGGGVPPASAVPAFGSVNVAGQVPARLQLTSPAAYSDGSQRNYANFSGAFTLAPGVVLSSRNDLMGDFNNDNVRNVNDAAALVSAVQNPRGFVASEGLQPGSAGAIPDGNYVIPEIIGDFNGDGNFDAADVRYFADGLALTTGANPRLDRNAGFTAVDVAFGGNYFGTSKIRGAYANGDSRADIAAGADGNQTAACNVKYTQGYRPTGHDGRINLADINYVSRNFGDWSNLDDAVDIDLSADMNGDLVVDDADVDAILAILGTTRGDFNLDGVVNAADQAITQANLGTVDACYGQGDFNLDGVVNAADLGGSNCGLCGDSNCDGSVSVGDIGAFVVAVSQGQAAWDALPGTNCDFICANDTNGDNAVTVGDIGPFVATVTGTNPCQ